MNGGTGGLRRPLAAFPGPLGGLLERPIFCVTGPYTKTKSFLFDENRLHLSTLKGALGVNFGPE